MPVPPSGVTGVEVQGVELGVVPPQLEQIKSYNLPGNAWQMDATLVYQSDIRIVIAAGMFRSIKCTSCESQTEITKVLA